MKSAKFLSFLFLSLYLFVHLNLITGTSAPFNSNVFESLVEESSSNAFLDECESPELLLKASKQCVPASDVLETLIKQLNALPILQQELYLKSYYLNFRNIVDMPAFYPHMLMNRKSQFGMDFFYNQTSRMYFTKECDGIASYLAITDPELLEKISQCFCLIQSEFPDFSINPVDLLPHFKGMTVQERRTGIMIHGDKRSRNLTFHLHVPLYYLERNYYMTDEERFKIERTLAPSTGPESDKSFKQELFISDKFGFGDTRVNFDWCIYNRNKMRLDAGLQATIPTAFAIQKGLMGTYFQCNLKRSYLSFQELFSFDEADTEQATKMVTDFFLNAFQNLSAILIDTQLGYKNHFCVGPTLQANSPLSFYIKQRWARRIRLKWRLTVEVPLPSIEDRRYLKWIDPDDFDASNFDLERAEVDQAYACERLNFLQQSLSDRFFPYIVPTRIWPGVIINSFSRYCYTAQPWTITVVSDTWVRTKEHFMHLHKCPETPRLLEICKAHRPFAYQSRLGLAVGYALERPTHTWHISLYLDAAYASLGIGKDFTGSISIESNF